MADISWKDVERLFEEALALPPEERADFLNAECEDQRLREEVSSLLAAHEEGGDFFEQLVDTAVAPLLEELEEPVEERSPGRVSDPLQLEGRQRGRYAVEEHLGGGGMGVVYRARDTELGRMVALKFLPPYLTSHREARERFVREARAAAGLDHSNVATVHEIGETEEGRRFIAMAYYEGETLKEKIARDGPLPIGEATGYAIQIAEGLAAAHGAGIVHRDIKPANVMVTDVGEVKIVDFGLAKAAAGTRLTAAGEQLGTAAYMSPEQARGEDVDGRTDLWALGVVMYEMLTGHRPFGGQSEQALLYEIVHVEPRPVSELRPEVSGPVAKVVARLLAKAPAGRYASAEALLKALQAVDNERSPADAFSASTLSPIIGRVGRRWVLGGIILLGGLLGVWVLWEDDSAERENPSAAGHSIAVLPFEVSGAGAETWRDGMATVLNAGLDGAAGLRAIPARTVFAAWEQLDSTRAEAQNDPALAAARRVEAGYAVAGSAVVLGGQLRLIADVYDAGSGRRLGRARAAGSPDSVMALSDHLTREVLEVLLERSDERIPSVNLASMTTESLPALKAYLAGERHFRSGQYEAAIESYRRATHLDSSFALAYSRLVRTVTWTGADATDLLQRAYELSDALPLRERRFVWAQYTWRVPDRPLPVIDSLRQWTDIYPDDPSLWSELGEVLFHTWRPGSWSEAEEAFEQAITLDPAVAAYHNHLVDMAFFLHRDSTLAADRIKALPSEALTSRYRTPWDLVFGAEESRREVIARLDSLPLQEAVYTSTWIGFWLVHPEDLDLKLRVLERLADQKNPVPEPLAYRMFYTRYFRGQMAEALPLLEDIHGPAREDRAGRPSQYGLMIEPGRAQSLRRLAAAANLGYPVPDSMLQAHFDPSRLGDGPSLTRLICTGIYLIERGREDEIDPLLDRIRNLRVGTGRGEIPAQEIRTAIDELRGYRAWKSGDLEGAVTYWSGLNGFGTAGAIWRGDLYRELGDLQQAEGWYQTAWAHPVAHERMGRLYEQMNRTEEAAAAYQRFIEAWEEADESLQDRVRRARERLRQLQAVEPRRAPS